ncbi:hypothetical protein Taro_056911 [Colocasia esculenta]|uniref:Uncharacterized protein n=1 Tax=Colocasia esculenta TaxID=4460 RepID=A0A843XXX7_COLES|nr:hypothetical protein [Colocasia esculenta]
MFGHPYPRPGEEISRRVEHDFRSLRCSGTHIHDLGRRSSVELNTTSNRCDWAAPRVGSTCESHKRGSRYC